MPTDTNGNAAPGDPGSWRRKGRELFSIDLRSLAVFRLSLASMILIDLIRRTPDLVGLYTDYGAIPRELLIAEFRDRSQLSLHFMLSGSVTGVACLFVIAGIFALMMMVGYRTRLATIASWLLLMSFQNRANLVGDSGDGILLLLLFWGMFLPLGARFSIDSALNTSPRRASDSLLSVGTAALLIQICLIYLAGIPLKLYPFETHQIWWRGEAIHYALHRDLLATTWGMWLRQFAWLLPALTYATLAIEGLGPLLAFSPWRTGPCRTMAVMLFICLHIGFAMFIVLGLFPLVCITGWLVFLPNWLWDKLFDRLRRSRKRKVTIFFDNDCSFCQKAVRLIHTFLLLPETTVKPAQSDESIHRQMHDHNSWIVVDDRGQHHWGFKGVLAVSRASPLLALVEPMLAGRPVRWAGGLLYAWTAGHRRLLSAIFGVFRERPLRIDQSMSGACIAAAALAFVLVSNYEESGLPGSGKLQKNVSPALRSVGVYLHIAQRWGMFSPHPAIVDGWYVISARLADGAHVDLLTKRDVSWKKPDMVADMFPGLLWARYLLACIDYRHWPKLSYYARYLCRQWNRDHPAERRVEVVDIYIMYEQTSAPQKPPNAVEKVFVLSHDCRTGITRYSKTYEQISRKQPR